MTRHTCKYVAACTNAQVKYTSDYQGAAQLGTASFRSCSDCRLAQLASNAAWRVCSACHCCLQWSVLNDCVDEPPLLGISRVHEKVTVKGLDCSTNTAAAQQQQAATTAAPHAVKTST